MKTSEVYDEEFLRPKADRLNAKMLEEMEKKY
jgi:hypothetical protein